MRDSLCFAGLLKKVMFDPACYYGDQDTDLAMTELFGGFTGDFYAAYQLTYPLDAGYKTRKTLYNLYHILNHVNLFGSGYLQQANRMMERLLAELNNHHRAVLQPDNEDHEAQRHDFIWLLR